MFLALVVLAMGLNNDSEARAVGKGDYDNEYSVTAMPDDDGGAAYPERFDVGALDQANHDYFQDDSKRANARASKSFRKFEGLEFIIG